MFINNLYSWHAGIDRDLPWTFTKDPYKIWISEIILQQTRVEQGRAYYEKFVNLWPTAVDLANAPIDDVLRAWQGLGYYSRARNLHFTAQIVRDKYNGFFPSNYEDILRLKGIGRYTAAAIGSFAFGLCYPVLDGNVMRVMARYHGITAPVDNPSTIKEVYYLLQKTIDKDDPAHFNQAMMDFGATLCTPKNPDCSSCIFSDSCKAYIQKIVDMIPLKVKKVKRTTRYFHYLEISDGLHLTVEKRHNKDIWQGLYQLPMIEMKDDAPLSQALIAQSNYFNDSTVGKDMKIISSQKLSKHVLTHQDIIATVHRLETHSVSDFSIASCETILISNLDKIGFPKLLVSYLEKYKIID